MSTVLPTTITTVLIGAAAAIRKRGWCRFNYVAPAGQVCMIGAIVESIRDSAQWSPEFTLADQVKWDALHLGACAAVKRFIPYEFNISGWNDYACNDGEEAAQMLERAAGVGQ